ncbi:Cob(I)yrinic acid a,c-diamide adenosyltransferase [Phycisphaerae bacterium RAS1]|nr:Cob(I)yrinic acid a,c-diamide adenosyltransferase [Phycisphaerae bacterium RAS1]
MPRITKVYTRTGDDGTTGLGSGARVSKTATRIECYGTVDELNSVLGAILAAGPKPELIEPLRRIQNELFHVGADLCVPEADKARVPGPRIGEAHVTALETLMDRLSERLDPLENFILPGGTLPAAELHVARCVCRRAERIAIRLREEEPIGAGIIPYLNRLSDALFVMARYQNKMSGAADPVWDSRA